VDGKEGIIKIFIGVSIMIFVLSFSVTAVIVGGNDNVGNLYFSMKYAY
jgi:hypothetical protein